MGVDTKGVVVTKSKDAFFVLTRIEEALNALIEPGYKQEGGFRADSETRKFKRCSFDITPSMGSVRMSFRYKGENRIMSINFDCDCDHREFGEQSIIFSLGCSGEADLFIKTALKAVSMLGTVLFDHSDSDDIDIAPYDIEPVTWLSTAIEGEINASQLSLETWYRVWRNGDMREGSAKAVLGLDEAEIKAYQVLPFEEANAKLEAVVDSYKILA